MSTHQQEELYSSDEKILLRCPNVKRYRIAEGRKETDEHIHENRENYR